LFNKYVENPGKEQKLSDKLQKNLATIPENPGKFNALVQNSVRSNTFSLNNSNKSL